MKVAIVTITKGSNHGNKLQNLAVQNIIENLGFEVETLRNNEDVLRRTKISTLKSTIKKFLVGRRLVHKRREAMFEAFKENYLKMSKYHIDNDNVANDIQNYYDFFVCGSDQIWNPNFLENGPANFLQFVPENKRISFAPSFGSSFIPESRKQEFKKYMEGLPFLSVREMQGAKMIKDLTGRDATVLVDPTLLLSKEYWLSISREPQKAPKRDYLLTYFLGKVSREKYRAVQALARKNNLIIRNLASANDKYTYTSGPSEFIYLINSAAIFLTDSFHGAVFSIILEKPFIVFNRDGKMPSMSSRLDTLLSKFKFEHRKWDNMQRRNDIFTIDFSHVIPILEAERKKALDYLKHALNVNAGD